MKFANSRPLSPLAPSCTWSLQRGSETRAGKHSTNLGDAENLAVAKRGCDLQKCRQPALRRVHPFLSCALSDCFAFQATYPPSYSGHCSNREMVFAVHGGRWHASGMGLLASCTVWVACRTSKARTWRCPKTQANFGPGWATALHRSQQETSEGQNRKR
jgi:hypothetical protein